MPNALAYPFGQMETFLKPGLVLTVAAIADVQFDLHPLELDIAREMTPRRLREFRAARTLGRLALTALDKEPSAITRGNGGEPLWHPGVVGSLAHSDTFATALVSTVSTCEAVGVDIIDGREIMPAEAVDLMNSGEVEIAFASQIAPPNRERAREIVFSIKEAVFKCQYTKTRWADLDFDEIEIVQTSRDGSPVGIKLLRASSSYEGWFSRIDLQFKQFQTVTLAIATVAAD
jgi:4'-phosphopantetheinyl transferase EntD